MAEAGTQQAGRIEPPGREGWARWLPSLEWLPGYRAAHLGRDARAGLFVAILLIPQAMAYALLADLPPHVGLWAAILPPLVYAFLGTSRVLAVGPVALVSLLVGETVALAAAELGTEPVEVGLTLALLTGLVMVILGALRVGFLINFISAPVLTGFAAAAAVLIATSQLRHLLGIDVPRTGGFLPTLTRLVEHHGETRPATAVVGAAALVFLLLARGPLSKALARLGVDKSVRTPLVRSAPLVAVLLGGLAVYLLELEVAVVGAVEAGLPPLIAPPLGLSLGLSVARDLFPTALAIAILAFVTAVAIAKALATRRDSRIDASQELVAIGMANLAASLTGGYPVGGSVSRSAVASESKAATPLHSLVSALLVAGAALFAGPLLAYLPNAVLAAVIITAVFRLVDLRSIHRTWLYSRPDGLSLAVTFTGVLLLGLELGLVIGAASGVALYLWRTSQPRVVVEGRLGDSEQFRGEDRTGVFVRASPVLVLRVDQDLVFANTEHFEERVLEEVAQHDGVTFLLLDFRAVNEIDASALSMLEELVRTLEEAGVTVHLSEIKQPVLEQLDRVRFPDRFGLERMFVSTHEAVETLEERHSACSRSE